MSSTAAAGSTRHGGPVRWGFLGAGFVASRGVGPVVHRAGNAVLQVVAARDPARAFALEPIRVETSYSAVCDADDVDVVYLSLPNDSHREWVLAALAAGKHVLCEKPLGLTSAEVAEMEAAARDAGRLLVEGSWNRWHPRTRRVEELVARTAGPREVASWFTFDGVPEDNYRLDRARGGGALLDVGCYAVAAALVALGPDVTVTSVERHLGPTGVDLTTSAVLASTLGSATVTGSFERPESQAWRIETPDLLVEVPHPAFTSWREPSTLRVVESGVERLEAFAACDAYLVMVEAVSARVRGDDSAWILPCRTSYDVAAALEAIARA